MGVGTEMRGVRAGRECCGMVVGQAAVPVGGGGAWSGFEIDHSEPPGSRVAISRAGRRPPAHTAARPNKHNEAARPHRGRAAHASGR